VSTRIWEECNGAEYIQHISVQPYRAQIVDDMATRSLVDNREEETILEQMLGKSSSNLSESLLREKFKGSNGSRFGSSFEQTIWYGSINKITALTERAFLIFRYLFDNEHIVSINAPGQDVLIFSANISTAQGVELHQSPFDEFENMISSPISYESSRPLGTAMRNADVLAFTYVSARDLADPRGINVGVFSMDAFVDQSPIQGSYELWSCIANRTDVEFRNQNPGADDRIIFNINNFLVDGVLPQLN
jgi:hypothetical protein